MTSFLSTIFNPPPAYHMGRILYDEIVRSIKKQFALMKKDYRYGQWNWSCISITEVTGLDKCMPGLPSEWEMRSEPGVILLQIHEFTWWGSLRVADRSTKTICAEEIHIKQQIFFLNLNNLLWFLNWQVFCLSFGLMKHHLLYIQYLVDI